MELLERETLRTRLDVLLGESAAGPGKLVFLGGEAGVGKTSLLQQFTRDLPKHALVAMGACDPLSTPRPLLPILDMAEALGPEVRDCLSEERPREQLFDAVRISLGRPDVAPVAIIEDAHWADESTLDLVRYLARRLNRICGLLIVSYRDDQVGADHPLRVMMGDIATCAGLHRMVVPRLSMDAVSMLAEDTPFDAKRLYRRTGGNPFFVDAVLQCGEPGIPETIRDAVLAGMARLPKTARRVLQACSVLGPRVDRELLASIEIVESDDLEACVGHGMLQRHGNDLHFRHVLVSEAINATLPPERAQKLHQAALAALIERQPQDPSRLAHHAECAGDGNAVLRFAPDAARQASRAQSHREAAAQYARALRHGGRLPDRERAKLLDALAWEFYLVDRGEDSIVARREAVALWQKLGDETAEGNGQRWLSRSLWVSGRNDEARRAGRNAVALLERHPPGHPLAMAYSNQAQLCMLSLDLEQTVAWGSKAIELATSLGDTESLAHALNNVGTVRIVNGDEGGRDDLERSLQLAEENGYEDHVARAYTNLGSCYCERYQFTDALHYLERGIAFCHKHDLDYLRAYMEAYQSRALIFLGLWNEASELALKSLRNPGSAAVNRVMAGIAIGRIRARRGDPDVWKVLDEALELAQQTGDLQRLAPVRRARAEAAWLGGDVEKTTTEARADYPLALEHGHPWFLGELAYWRWKSGDLDDPPSGCAEPYALEMAGKPGQAAKAWEELGCAYEAAWAHMETESEQNLRVAHESFVQLGAGPAASLAAECMRNFGMRGLSRGPRASTRANPSGLTSCQFAVLKLLVQGMSNADIAGSLHRSTRTIDHHVAAILAKLDVRSRTDATRVALERGIVTAEPG